MNEIWSYLGTNQHYQRPYRWWWQQSPNALNLVKCSEAARSRLRTVDSHQQISVYVDTEVMNRRGTELALVDVDTEVTNRRRTELALVDVDTEVKNWASLGWCRHQSDDRRLTELALVVVDTEVKNWASLGWCRHRGE